MTVVKHEFYRFVGYLEGLAGRGGSYDRAALAALRRGLGKRPGEAPEVFPYLVPWTAELDEQSQEAYYLVASLFALHPLFWRDPDDGSPSERWKRNLGASFRRVAEDKGGEVRGSSTERRFVALLNSERADLGERLRHAVSLCKAKEVPIDWGLLLDDVMRWANQRRPVQRSWARAFWYQPPKTEETGDTPNSE